NLLEADERRDALGAALADECGERDGRDELAERAVVGQVVGAAGGDGGQVNGRSAAVRPCRQPLAVFQLRADLQRAETALAGSALPSVGSVPEEGVTTSHGASTAMLNVSLASACLPAGGKFAFTL